MNTPFQYTVYGIALHSETRLDLPLGVQGGPADVELQESSAAQFNELVSRSRLIERDHWYHYAHMEDGSIYVRWKGVGQFIVSAQGDRIWCARAPAAAEESFQVYLLGQALAVALVKSGQEPLHGTAVELGGSAIAILGGSGFGKSTLAASLIAAGGRLLTDDLLLTRPGAAGLVAYPGPARIKLFPRAARRFLGVAATGVPMNSLTNKQVIALGAHQRCPGPVALRAIYVLAPPGEMRSARRVRIEPLVGQAAFLALVQNTFNRFLVDPGRMRRQLAVAAGLVRTVPVRKLTYSRAMERLPVVGAALMHDGGLLESRAA